METDRQSGFPAAVQYPSSQPNSSELALVPYAKVGNEWTLSDAAVLAFATRAAGERVLETVFMDGRVRTPADFLEMVQELDNIPVFIFSGQECVAAAWLNGCVGRVAFGHFLVLRAGRGDAARRAGKLVLSYWRSFAVGNAPLFDVILGLIPSANERAIRFVQEIGLTRLGEIPKMLRGESATLLYLAR